MSALVVCSCGWSVEGLRPGQLGTGVAAALEIAPHVHDMVQHWRNGHQLSCLADLRHVVRRCLQRYRQLTRARDDRDAVAREARRRGIRFESYDPFTDEWTPWR